MPNAKKVPRKIPDHVKKALEEAAETWCGGVKADLARKLDVDPHHFQKMMRGETSFPPRLIATFNRAFKQNLLWHPAEKLSSVQKVMTVVSAVEALDAEAADLLTALIEFRLGGEQVNVAKMLAAIDSISTLRGALQL